MIRFDKQPTAGGSMKWDVRRTHAEPFLAYLGSISLSNGVANLQMCGLANAVELAHTSAFMLELEAQYRANANSEQIEKDLQPVARMEVNGHDTGDCHSRADKFARVDPAHAVDAQPAMVGSVADDRVHGGER